MKQPSILAIVLLLCAALLFACARTQPVADGLGTQQKDTLNSFKTNGLQSEDGQTMPATALNVLSATACRLDSMGYVNVSGIHPGIFVSLMYARPDNFTGQILYTDLREAFVHPDAAEPLRKAQELLFERRPDCHLIVLDAARPMSVQQIMWQAVARTAQRNYVSNPAHGGGMHNYGLAVDVSLCNAQGDTLPMGSRVDHLGPESHLDYERTLLKGGESQTEAANNRRLLREVMRAAGFHTISSEWWHFNLVSRATARAQYPVIP